MTNRALTICILLWAANAFAGDVSKVTVRNSDFQVIKTLNDKEPLEEFSKIWGSKQVYNGSEIPQWLYKLDIEQKGHGNRWLYDPKGYVQVLSKARVPVYVLPPEPFNKLIGAHNQ